ncbi:MAG: hypothetical protein ACF8QF_12650 [Phycisphaerales bacterium]
MTRSRSLRSLLAATFSLCALAPGVGCAVEPQGGRPVAGSATESGSVFRPESIRIHPLTRVIASGDGAGTLIDAHVELFDRWGHPTKGLGTMRFELFRSGAGGIGTGPEGGIDRAEVDLTDPEINSTRYYDSATRTYRMYLESPPDAASLTMSLVVTFVTSDGRRLRDEYALGTRVLPRDGSGDENAPPAEGRQGGG